MQVKILFVLLVCCTSKVCAQSIDPVSLLIGKIVKALDLQVQKLQNQTLSLQQLQLVAEHELSKTKLAEIADWQQRQQALYDGYFKELQTVKNAVKSLTQIRQIVSMQADVIRAYKKISGSSTNKDRLLSLSHDILQSLEAVTNNGQMAMNDAARIKAILRKRDAMEECLAQMLAINKVQQHAAIDSLQRLSDFQLLKRLNNKR